MSAPSHSFRKPFASAMSMNGGTRMVADRLAGHQRIEAVAHAADQLVAALAPVDAGARQRPVEHEDEAVGGGVDRDRVRRGVGEAGELSRGTEGHDHLALELRQDLQPGFALVVPRDDVVDHADADVPGAVGEALAQMIGRQGLRRLDLHAMPGEQTQMLGPHDRRGRHEQDLLDVPHCRISQPRARSDQVDARWCGLLHLSPLADRLPT